MLFSRDKVKMVAPEQALPGRDESIRSGAARRARDADRAAVPEGLEQVVVGMGCFWGAERIFWQAAGRLHDRGRLRGRLHAEPDLRGGVLRADRPHRGRAGRLRSRADLARRDPARLLGGPRPDPGHAAGQRRRHAVPLGALLDVGRAARSGRGVARPLRGATRDGRLRRDHDGARTTPGRSTTPSRTTSSTSRRTRTATAASAARRRPARSASASRSA